MRANLKELLVHAQKNNVAVPCFNIFGYEDALAVVKAAEACNAPVILATNKDMVEFAGLRYLAGMLNTLADQSSAKICVHLDHCYEDELVKQAIDEGYHSVMFDGSQLALEENISRTRALADYAHIAGVSVEGEIGSVPYSEGRDHIRSELTDPDQACAYSEQSGADAIAVSIGNVHRLTNRTTPIDFARLELIRQVVKQPLVVHGTSGIEESDIQQLARTAIAKFNIGTKLRQVFGQSLRNTLAANPEMFDRLQIVKEILPSLEVEASRHIRLLRPEP